MSADIFSSEIVLLLLWVFFTAASALSIIVGLMLVYHWLRYSTNPFVSLMATVLYAGGCFVLLSTMFAALLSM